MTDKNFWLNVGGIDDISDETAGMESFEDRPFDGTKPTYSIGFFEADMKLAKERREMCRNGGCKYSCPLLVRTHDKKHYRVYFRADMFFDSQYLNKILCFLDSRTAGQTVTLIIGTKMDDFTAHNIGSLLSAIQRCRATVIGVCAGYCSITETMIWCFCPQRRMYRYGALTFGTTDIVSTVPSYMHYFDLFFKQAQKLNILTEEECEHLKSTGSEQMILYSDYFKRTNDSSV